MTHGFKILMVDVDGVVVRHPQGLRWDHALEHDLGLKPDDLQRAFFEPNFEDVVLGRADLHERLSSVLSEIAPHLTATQLTDYWFSHDSHLDERLLADLGALRKGGIPLHLATVQEHRRAAYLWTTLRLSERFDAMHYAADVGAKKPDAAFFATVTARTDLRPSDLFLIDDSARNIDAAKVAGWGAALWDGRTRLAEVLAGH